MKWLLSVVVVAMFAPHSFADDKKNDTKPAQSISELRQQIEIILKDTHTPGASVAIVHRDGPEWVAGIGKADVASGRDATDETLFRIGSTSKAFASMSILLLADQGKLSLDGANPPSSNGHRQDSGWTRTWMSRHQIPRRNGDQAERCDGNLPFARLSGLCGPIDDVQNRDHFGHARAVEAQGRAPFDRRRSNHSWRRYWAFRLIGTLCKIAPVAANQRKCVHR